MSNLLRPDSNRWIAMQWKGLAEFHAPTLHGIQKRVAAGEHEEV